LIPSQLSAKIEEQARNLALNDASDENSSSSSSMFNLPKSLRMKVTKLTLILLLFTGKVFQNRGRESGESVELTGRIYLLS
jgi:hypothetical protein